MTIKGIKIYKMYLGIKKLTQLDVSSKQINIVICYCLRYCFTSYAFTKFNMHHRDERSCDIKSILPW